MFLYKFSLASRLKKSFTTPSRKILVDGLYLLFKLSLADTRGCRERTCILIIGFKESARPDDRDIDCFVYKTHPFFSTSTLQNCATQKVIQILYADFAAQRGLAGRVPRFGYRAGRLWRGFGCAGVSSVLYAPAVIFRGAFGFVSALYIPATKNTLLLSNILFSSSGFLKLRAF
jgi:hypothetical protein